MFSTPCIMWTLMHNAHHSAIVAIKWHKLIVQLKRTKSTMRQMEKKNSCEWIKAMQYQHFYLPVSFSLAFSLEKLIDFFYSLTLQTLYNYSDVCIYKNYIMNGQWDPLPNQNAGSIHKKAIIKCSFFECHFCRWNVFNSVPQFVFSLVRNDI